MNLSYIKKTTTILGRQEGCTTRKKNINERRSNSSKKKIRRTDSKHLYV